MGLLPFLGGIAAGALDAFSGSTSAKMSRDAFRHRYQDTVQDMRKAGLNPALAYGQGGGGGAQNQTLPELGSSVARGVGAAANARQSAATADLTSAQSALLKLQSADLVDQIKLRNELLRQEAKLTEEKGFLTTAQATSERERAASIRQVTENARQSYLWNQQTWDQRKELISRELKKRGLSITEQEITNELLRLSRPQAEAEASFYEGAGQYSPYVNSALDIVRALMPKISLGGRATQTVTSTKTGRGYKHTTSTRRNVK